MLIAGLGGHVEEVLVVLMMKSVVDEDNVAVSLP
jgi:hypothetical protein